MKVAPNDSVCLLENFHIFRRLLDIFPILFLSCAIGKDKNPISFLIPYEARLLPTHQPLTRLTHVLPRRSMARFPQRHPFPNPHHRCSPRVARIPPVGVAPSPSHAQPCSTTHVPSQATRCNTLIFIRI
jgi:hypothetical protein